MIRFSIVRPEKRNFADCLVVKEKTRVLTLRSPTNRPCDTQTHMKHPQHFLSTVTIYYCDTSTLWWFSTVTFWPKVDKLFVHQKNGRFVTVWHFNPPKFLPTHGCDILSTSDFDILLGFLTLKSLAFEGTVARGFPTLVGCSTICKGTVAWD